MDILNEEFARLLTSSGWKQSEAAKHLELSPAVITRYLNKDTRPSLTVLKLFKLLIGDMQPLPGDGTALVLDGELERPLDAAERQLVAQLRRLPDTERRRVVQGFCAVLNAVAPLSAAKGPTTNGEAKAVAKRVKKAKTAGR